MMRAIHKGHFIFGICALVLAGCASKSEFQEFAALGESYAASLPPVFASACQVQIDANSAKLIASLPDVTTADVEAAAQDDRSSCEKLGLLSQHAALLGTYFAKLGEVAATNDDGALGASAAGLFDELVSVGSKIREFPNLPLNGEAIAAVTNAIVNARIESVLRAELSARKDLLAREFATLGAGIALLATENESLQTQIEQTVIDQQVYRTLTETQNPSQADLALVRDGRRIEVRGMPGTSAFAAAQKASNDVQAAFQTLITEDPDTELVVQRLQALARSLAQLQALVSLLSVA